MVARFLWILHVLVVNAYARGIWVPDFQNVYTLSEEELRIQPYVFENQFREVTYRLKNFLKYGDQEVGIPPFDPFFLPFKEFDFVLRDAKLAGYLQGVTFTNFSRFEADTVELKLLPLHFKLDLRIDRFQIDGRYGVQGKIVDNPVNGSGEFMISVKSTGRVLTVFGLTTICAVLRHIKRRPQDHLVRRVLPNLWALAEPRLMNADSLTSRTRPSKLEVLDCLSDAATLIDGRVRNETDSTPELCAFFSQLNYTNELCSGRFQLMDEDVILYILDQVQEDYVPPLFNTAKILLNRFLLGYTTADLLTFVMTLFHKE